MKRRSRARRFRIAGILLVAMATIVVATGLSGCGAAAQAIEAPLWQADVTKCDGRLPPLPEPEVWRVRRALTAEQTRRQKEVDEIVARGYCKQRFRVTRTTQDRFGRIVDWVDITDMPDFQFLWPAGSQPNPIVGVPRRTLDSYVRGETQARSLEEFLTPPAPGVGVLSVTANDLDLTGCDLMAIAPTPVGGPAPSNCSPWGGANGHFPYPGYSLCLAATGRYTADSTKTLRECLEQIDGPPVVACDVSPVNECVSRMYKAAPPSQVAADACRIIKDKVCGRNTRFDLSACTEGLKPFSNDALGMLGWCMRTIGEPDCQKAYQTCFSRTFSY